MKNMMRLFIQVLRCLRLRPRARPPHTDAESEAAFYATLERQFIEVHERQRQHTAGLWRATDDCPSPFRIQTGELSAEEEKHIKSCHLCWLLYDLTRFDRSVGELRLNTRRAARWMITSPLAPVVVGLIILIGLSVVHVWATGRVVQTIRGSQRMQGPPALPNVASEPVVESVTVGLTADSAEERRRRLELELRRLPPEIEMQRRLGPRFGREFESLRQLIDVYVPPNSDLGRRLSATWLETLRTAGNGLFVDIVAYQVTFSSRVQPESLVALAEAHAELARFVNRRHLLSFLEIQARVALEAQRESGLTGGAPSVGARLLEEAVWQRDSAAPSGLGQSGALRVAHVRHEARSAVARR